jgi:hypothetical protein
MLPGYFAQKNPCVAMKGEAMTKRLVDGGKKMRKCDKCGRRYEEKIFGNT